MMRNSESDLATRLLQAAASGPPNMPYRLARMVARVLVSHHLRERQKWCALAKSLAADTAVEARLIRQAMDWLQRRPADP